jgi:predicted RNA binding protein YcfA (HicA-like mRNA interferase family)
MPKPAKRLPSDLPRDRVLRALGRLSFVLDRDTGDHSVYKHRDDESRMMVLPRHSRIKRQLLRGILAGAGVTEEQFMDAY